MGLGTQRGGEIFIYKVVPVLRAPHGLRERGGLEWTLAVYGGSVWITREAALGKGWH